ncbi:hypothetical protein DFA_04981 [Cavenderia fasciculata]|uniref:Uncharacterized protein n=1 Tax=Cavenderia fasciculata TaxID=261658 RepID=F4PMQ4_CACFS|nr:uncharacterized protein DFA_04981 [Cavenderia fasciculata]EGG22851.1 hypothetical protein DFA_04981 [Cavenderia fasciculata]|eukprot:XP_004360702.1 hypothetical protein DFA_04981 [Cavenderia fasciculata]
MISSETITSINDNNLQDQTSLKSLNEYIVLNQTDLFIQQFMRIDTTNENPFFKSNFNQLLFNILKYENQVAFEFVVGRLRGLAHDFVQFVSNQWKPMGFGFGIHPGVEPIKWEPTKKSVTILLPHVKGCKSAMLYSVLFLLVPVSCGDLELFNQICKDILDLNQKERFYYNSNHITFKDLIYNNDTTNNNNNQNNNNNPNNNNNNNNQSKYEIIYYIVNKLKNDYDMDLRRNLFVDALECSRQNNQEILKWIKDSFGGNSIDKFDFYDRDYLFLAPIVERYASLETLKLLEFPPNFFPMSTNAAKYGNKDFLSYMATKNYKYLYQYAQIETALKEGHLDCVYLLNDAILKFDELGEKGYCRIDLFLIDSIHPSIMSLDLVKLLGANPFLKLTVQALALSAISAKQLDTLDQILSQCNTSQCVLSDQDKNNLVVGALYVADNTAIIEYLLNRFYPNSSSTSPVTFQVSSDNFDNISPQSLEYLSLKNHQLVKVSPSIFAPSIKKQLNDTSSLAKYFSDY